MNHAMHTKRLRIVSTVLLAFAVAQTGFAAGFIGGTKPLLAVHALNAFAVLIATIAAVLVGLAARRAGAPKWAVMLPLGIVVAIGLQIVLGFAELKGPHVFLGVLIVSTVTAYCSYSWRLDPTTLDLPKPARPTPVTPTPLR